MFLLVFTDVVSCGGVGGYVHPPAPKLEAHFVTLVDESVLEFASLLDQFDIDIFVDEALVEFIVVIRWQEYRFCFCILKVSI